MLILIGTYYYPSGGKTETEKRGKGGKGRVSSGGKDRSH